MSIYDVSAIGTDDNKVQFNDFSNYPVYRLRSRTPQQRQIRDYDLPIPDQSGISDFQTLIGKMAYVIVGTIYPDGFSGGEAALRKLRKACNLDVEQADILSDGGYVPYVYTEEDGNKQIFVKPLYVSINETTQKGLIQDFQIICKIKDPIIYGATLKQANTGVANFSVSTGSAGYPFGYPIGYGSSTTTVSIDAHNSGDTPIYPLGISIFGPVNAPKITNLTTGEYIQVNCNLATSDNNLIIQYDKDTLIITLDGISQINNVTTGSTYFKLRDDSNIMQLSGSTISDGAYAIVSFYDGYSLS